MEIDFLGARLDFDLIERLPESITFTISQEGSPGPQALTDCSFSGVLVDQRGKKQDLEVHKSDNSESATVHFPALVAGEYRYEIWILTTGGEMLLVRGRVGVLSSVRAERLQDEAGERRAFHLRLPAISGKRVLLMARSGNIAAMWADRARERAEKAEGEADRAEKAAQEAAEEAKKLIDIDEYIRQIKEGAEAELDDIIEEKREDINKHVEKKQEDFENAVRDSVIQAEKDLEAKREELQEALDQMAALRGKIAELQKDIRDSIFIDEEGFIWIGGENTGHNATGEPGKSPYLDEDGHIHWWDAEAQEWKEEMIKAIDGFSPYVNEQGYWVERDPDTMEEVVTPYRAYGTDGINGDSVVRHIVNSFEEIPQYGDTCNGGHYYYVPKGDGEYYTIYAFLEDNAGRGAWYAVGEKNDISTPEVYGLNKLGTDVVIFDGIGVGVNDEGQMHIPAATFNTAGGVKVSESGTIGEGAAIGKNAAGQLMGAMADMVNPGSIRLSYGGRDCKPVIGLTAGGQTGVTQGGAERFGVFKGAELMSAENACFISADSSGYMRLDINGAGLVWGESGLSLKLGNDGRIVYSAAKNGLTVQEATTEMPGVVRIALNGDDEGGVPTMGSIREVLLAYASKDDLADYVSLSSFDKRLETALQSGDYDVVSGTQLEEKAKEWAAELEELKEKIKESNYISNEELIKQLEGYITSAGLTNTLKDYLTQAKADGLYMSISNTPVKAYADYTKMPSIEDQQTGVLYIGGQP